MPLVSSKSLLDSAFRENYALGAFNANNLEYVQGIVEGARAEASPVIIQASPGAIAYLGIDYIAAIVKVAAESVPIPVVLHLDHGKDLDIVAECVKKGFTSVMFDGSAYDFEENVRLTREAVDIAHRKGVPCEGELGKVPSSDRNWTREELEKLMTSPEEAREFVSRTGVDSLAVSVGSVHQMKEKAAELDIDRIRAIRSQVHVPLVLHGSSGVSDESLARAVKAGICKVNIATLLNMAFSRAVKDTFAREPEEIDPRKILGPARDAVASVVAERIRLLGSSRKAG
ncbi:MAG TPA: class II fructose-bisphosphate aldolase [Clostridia bacterium]|nr:class II fructose-bisphosphate aldolase [Clostridia bacterium]